MQEIKKFELKEHKDDPLFHIGEILSVITLRMLSPSGMDGIRTLVSYMVGGRYPDRLLEDAALLLTPELLKQFPFLSDIEVPEFSSTDEGLEWLCEIADKYGEWHKVKRSKDTHLIRRSERR